MDNLPDFFNNTDPEEINKMISIWQQKQIMKQGKEIDNLKKKHESMSIEKEKLKNELEEIKNEVIPKANEYDRMMEGNGLSKIGEASKSLKIPGMGRNKLFNFLRNECILNNENIPYQRYIDAKYFVVKEKSFDLGDTGKTGVNYTTYITQKGKDFVLNVYKKRMKELLK